jgi:sugar (pentulose or hexulose) kinase
MTTGAPALLLGIDVGTTLTKAGVVDEHGRELIRAAVPTVWQREPTGGYARPGDLLSAVRAVLIEVLAGAPSGKIVGVGVTSMAETVVLVNGAGEAIEPAVAWHDVRAAAEFAELRSSFGADTLGRRTGLGTSPIPTVATLKWLVRNVPDVGRATRALCVAEWIAYCLGGDGSAEASLASRTGALSVASQTWWTDVLEWAGVDPAIFPPIRSAGTSFGRVRASSGFEQLEGAVLTVAGHDHLCGSVGIGVTASTQAMDSCGTAEALVRAVPAGPERDLAAGLPYGIQIGWHVLAGHYAMIGALLLGLDFIPLLERLGARIENGHTDLDAAAIALGRDGAPALADTSAVGSLRAQNSTSLWATPHEGEPAAVTWRRAVASTVAQSRRLLDGLEQLSGPVTEVRVSGGWSHNPVLQELKAAVLPGTAYPLVAEAGIRGAALLSGLAAGVFPSVAEFPAPALDHYPGPQAARPVTSERAFVGSTSTRRGSTS